MPMKLALALRGVEHSGVLTDLRIIARTVAAVVRKREMSDDPVLDEARRRILQLNEDA
jgi:hypothetical protein